VKDVGVTLSATYRLNDSITLMMSGGLSRLLGDAGSSPVVADKNQPSAMLGLSYRF
jgi:outer membrane scaffolding protein for murein synthesis (MipA/OmpV family)